MKKLFLNTLAITIMALAWTACDDGDNTQSVTSITLNKSTLTLTEGQSETLSYTIIPDDATNRKVIWNSSNTSVATVNSGTVSAIKEGTTDIPRLPKTATRLPFAK
ncbi:MAG: Ig-like domain-containing protein [Tannerellaceae bacterium]|jgi:uncharacterized protein YjdB|nr:Ig-like domain-containing protein [Tannerellaceae bacterium]